MTRHLHFVRKTIIFSFFVFFSLSTLAQTYKWDNVAMGGGGFVAGIITSKKTPNVVYARTDVGGAYRWDNTAGKWVSLLDWITASQSSYIGVESIAVDPKNSNNVYMLVGTNYLNNGITAILRSNDGGVTFTITDVTNQFKAHGNGSARGGGEKLQVDPNNSATLWCGTRDNGLFKSSDAGATWAPIASLPVSKTKIWYASTGSGIAFVVLDSISGTVGNATKNMYVGVSTMDSTYNLYKSADGGNTFLPVTLTGAPNPRLFMPQRAVLAKDSNLIITYSNTPGPGGTSGITDSGRIYKYNTRTDVWTNITPTDIVPGSNFGGISVDPNNPLRIIASTQNTYRFQYANGASNVFGDRFYLTTDGGITWRNLMTNPIIVDNNGIPWINGSSMHWVSSIQFNPFNTNQAWANSGDGVFFCADLNATTNTWRFESKGIEETVPRDAVSIAGGPLVSVVSDYAGFINTSPNVYGARHNPAGGSNTGIAYAAKNINTLLRAAGSTLQYSTNQGSSWIQTAVINGSNGRVALSANGDVFVHNPGGSATTYRSVNNGSTWTACTGLAITDAIPVADYVNNTKLYAYSNSDGKFYASTDGAVSFTNVSTIATNGSKLIRTVPGQEGHIWIALGNGGLSRSTNGGTSFSTITGVTACTAVGIGKADSAATYPTIYIWGIINGVEGVYRSTNQGTSWVRVNDNAHQYGGLGNGQFVLGDMNVFGRWYMSTLGRGIAYGEQLTAAPPPVIIDSSFSIRLFPSPIANNTAGVTINLRYTQNIVLKFIRMNGTVVATKTVTALPGTNKFAIEEMIKEPAGIYFLSAYSQATGDKLTTIKFLKL